MFIHLKNVRQQNSKTARGHVQRASQVKILALSHDCSWHCLLTSLPALPVLLLTLILTAWKKKEKRQSFIEKHPKWTLLIDLWCCRCHQTAKSERFPLALSPPCLVQPLTARRPRPFKLPDIPGSAPYPVGPLLG
ncbi:hypothetical protein VTO42DRAFT_2335 [Malbranchea cinnamomea]